MKTTALRTWTAVGLLVLTAAMAPRASANQSATELQDQKCYTGTIASVDAKERVLEMKGLIRSRKFNLGDKCEFVFLNNRSGDIAQLRPGQRVTVKYENAHGVLAACRVEQQPMCFTGTVKDINPQTHMLTLHQRALDKEFRIADGCMVTLRNRRSGALTDVRPGHYVTVVYELPDGRPTAREIMHTSATFTGTLTAIDMNERTVKAKTAFGTRKFHLGDGCQVVLNEKLSGELRDLRLGTDLVISYDEVNGVSVANRIAPSDMPEGATTAQATSQNY